MSIKKLLQEILDNINEVIQGTSLGRSLWREFEQLHPADIADFLPEIDKEQAYQLFEKLSQEVKTEVFLELTDSMKVYFLLCMPDQEVGLAFTQLSADELTDLFDLFSDEELKKYLRLLQKNVRDKVLSLLQFDPESAGGIMTTDVITLMEDFSVDKSIKLLQRLGPSKDIFQQIFVTNQDHQLVGHINLEDLVLQKPQERISQFMHKNELIVRASQDREHIAKKMIHYGLMTVPVVDDENHFIGVIPSETLVDIVVEEASEDVQKMSSLPALKQPYFEVPFFQLCFQRCYVLFGLFIAESFSSPIVRSYETLLQSTIILYSSIMLITSVGGNTGSQASAVIIQGMASGDISPSHTFRLLKREFLVSSVIAVILGATAFIRSVLIGGPWIECVIMTISISLIVFTSAMLGSIIPFLLKRINIDPALSAGPFLATIMDILGIAIFVYVTRFILA